MLEEVKFGIHWSSKDVLGAHAFFSLARRKLRYLIDLSDNTPMISACSSNKVDGGIRCHDSGWHHRERGKVESASLQKR